MILKPGKCSIIEHDRLGCWVYLHYILCFTQMTEQLNASLWTLELVGTIWRPKHTARSNFCSKRCMRGMWAVNCSLCGGSSAERLALCSWRTEPHKQGPGWSALQVGTVSPLLSPWLRPEDSELWCRPSHCHTEAVGFLKPWSHDSFFNAMHIYTHSS